MSPSLQTGIPYVPTNRYTLALSSSSKTGYRGVYPNPSSVSRPFRASVMHRGEKGSLGSFATSVEVTHCNPNSKPGSPQP